MTMTMTLASLTLQIRRHEYSGDMNIVIFNTLGEKLNEDGILAQSREEFTNSDATSRTDEESVTESTEREVVVT
ncbi:hypothetical protein MTR_3g118510 [Medicago truncatula]|uniref:Uncharacterized protein n=1 Tax=Medicago truncatula TaxID=3880 RepID=G7J9A7_MEDTR|nr:hypothetical protein MTR_3g118510 [Medicago truncatula]